MSKIAKWGILSGAVFGVCMFIAFGQEPAKDAPKKAPEKEKTITITESQLNDIVEKKLAQQLIEDTQTLDQKILEPKNWHFAYFRGVEYTIYTGPGQIMSTRWAPVPKPVEDEKPTEKPTEKPPEKDK